MNLRGRYHSILIAIFVVLGSLILCQDAFATGTLVISKDTDPAGFGGFEIDITSNPVVLTTTVMLDDGQSAGFVVAPSVFTLKEINIPSGFDLTDIDCVVVGGNGSTFNVSLATETVVVDLKDNDDVTCTFTNSGNGTITIEKESVPPGATGFEFTNNIPGGPVDFTLDDGESRTFNNIPAGSYDVIELNPDATPGGFELTDIVCDDMGSGTNVITRTAIIDLDPDEDITCTFTNTSTLEGLEITKSDSPDPVVAGNELEYRLTINNNTSETATDVMVSDVLAPGLIPIEISADKQGVNCLFNTGPPVEGACTIATMVPSEEVVITIVVIPDPTVFDDVPVIVSNTATMTANPGNIEREVTTNTLVNPVVSVVIESGSARREIERDQQFQIEYAITVEPNLVTVASSDPEAPPLTVAKADAQDVMFDVEFSPPLVALNAQTTQGSCTVGASVSCFLGDIIEGQTVTVIVFFRTPNENLNFNVDAIVTTLAQMFTNRVVIITTDDNGCALAAPGARPGVPVYLLLPLIVMAVRVWRRRKLADR